MTWTQLIFTFLILGTIWAANGYKIHAMGFLVLMAAAAIGAAIDKHRKRKAAERRARTPYAVELKDCATPDDPCASCVRVALVARECKECWPPTWRQYIPRKGD